VQTIVVLGLLFAVIVYRLAIVTALYSLPNITAKTNARLITSVTAALINLVVILILSKVGMLTPPRKSSFHLGLSVYLSVAFIVVNVA